MAIGYSLKIKGSRLDENILVSKFVDMNYTLTNTTNSDKGVSIDFYKELGFVVSLTEAGNYPYNSWETGFQKEDFVFKKSLEFRFDKEYDNLSKRYNVMLKIIFDLMSELHEEAILISNGDTELCLFKETGKILLNNRSKIWNRDYFKNVIKGKNIEYLA